MIFASVPVLQPPEEMNDTRCSWEGCGKELLIVDNTTDRAWASLAEEQGWSYLTFGRNLGVPSSWNAARAWFMAQTEREYDLLLLFSASVRWDDCLPDALNALSAAANWKGCQTSWGAHAIAWSRKVFERCGSFDESPFPGYYSDTDWFYRLILEGILVGGDEAMPRIDVNGECRDARALTHTGLISDTAASLEWFCAKWGGEPSAETFRTPFNSGLPTSWWTTAYRPGVQHINIGESRYRGQG